MSGMSGGTLRAPAECVVSIDGKEITELYPFLQTIEVRTSRGAASTCTLTLDTLRDERGSWLAQDQNLFVPWRDVEVRAQFGSYSEEVMSGFIKEVQADHPEDMAASVLVVTGQDRTLKLDREHIRRVWSTEKEQMADGNIVRAIAQKHNLKPDVQDGLRNGSLNQDGTDISFLKQRAEANGFELFVRGDTLHFHSSQLEGASQPTIKVYAGVDTNCLSFQVRYDGHKPDKVRVVRAAARGTRPESQIVEPDLALLGKTAATSESMGLPSFVWDMNQPHGATRAEADARAQAAANKNAWKIEATGELDGSLYGHVLLTHETVEVDGVGETYGGTYYVDEVTHAFSYDGYRQRFTLLRNATDA